MSQGLFSKQAAKIPHLNKGEIADLRADIAEELLPLAALAHDEFTNPPAADPDAFKASIATNVAAQEYEGDDLDGVVGEGELTYPRNVTVTASSSVGSYAGSVTFEGIDILGHAITEDVVITDATTTVGAKAFKKVTKISVPAQVNGAGALQFGFGALLGLARPIKTLGGRTGPIQEVAVGVVVTTGTFTTAAVGAPCGTYSPAAAADGTRDYAVLYPFDPTV